MNDSDNLYKREFIYTIPGNVLFDKKITDLDRKVFMVIQSFMHTKGNCFTSNNWLATALDVERRSIINSINRLIDNQYINKFTKNGKRYLVINFTPCPEEVVIPTPLASDPTIT